MCSTAETSFGIVPAEAAHVKVRMKSLSPMQRRILAVMSDGRPTAFTGEHARKLGFGVFEAKHGGNIIRAYQLPQWFLNNRKLIEIVKRDVPGTWYQITEAGRKCLSPAPSKAK